MTVSAVQEDSARGYMQQVLKHLLQLSTLKAALIHTPQIILKYTLSIRTLEMLLQNKSYLIYQLEG